MTRPGVATLRKGGEFYGAPAPLPGRKQDLSQLITHIDLCSIPRFAPRPLHTSIQDPGPRVIRHVLDSGSYPTLTGYGAPHDGSRHRKTMASVFFSRAKTFDCPIKALGEAGIDANEACAAHCGVFTEASHCSILQLYPGPSVHTMAPAASFLLLKLLPLPLPLDEHWQKLP